MFGIRPLSRCQLGFEIHDFQVGLLAKRFEIAWHEIPGQTKPLVRSLKISRHSAALPTIDSEGSNEAARCHRPVSMGRGEHQLGALLPLVRSLGPPIPRQIETLRDTCTQEEESSIAILSVAVAFLGKRLPEQNGVLRLTAVEEAKAACVVV